jgi:hypothetical protein
MWRPAVVRFGMLASAVACSGGSKAGPSGGGDPTIGNRGPLVASDSDMTASYWCSISNGEYDYPAMPCVIRQVNGRFELAKLAGSQRFRGIVRPRGDGFTFDGEFYCPWGDCTEPMHGVFAPTGDGKLRGTFRDNSIVVTMTRAADSGEWGGVGYGGSSYGGFGYGGLGYGGSTYGRPVPPRH